MKLLGKAISGTCGARTYSVGGAGVTARQKVCPVNKNSLAQARRRGLFAAAASAFKALTAQQREELHTRALAASETDIFGKKITLSDYAFFLREWMSGRREEGAKELTREEAFTLLMSKSKGYYVNGNGQALFLFEPDPILLTISYLDYNYTAGIKATPMTPPNATGKIFAATNYERDGVNYVGLIGNLTGKNASLLYGIIAEAKTEDARAIYFERLS